MIVEGHLNPIGFVRHVHTMDEAPYLAHCKARSSAEYDDPIISKRLFRYASASLKSCACSTIPGKVSIPGKDGTFGVEKWPEATTT